MGDAVELSGLRPAGGDPSGTVLTDAEHAGCPGHSATVEVTRRWSGEPEVITTWWCTDYQGHGHAPRWHQPTSGRGHSGAGHSGAGHSGAGYSGAGYGGAGGGVGSGARQPGPVSDAEKAERRRVVTCNRDWESATVVRKDWLQGFLARRSAPKDAARYIADTLARGSHDVRNAMENSHRSACALLGLDAPAGWYFGTPNPITVALATAGGARLTVITLAVLLGAAEDGTSRDSWRNPTPDTRAYFAALADWGYPLAPVEQLITIPDTTTGATETGGEDADAGDTASEDADDGEHRDGEDDTAEEEGIDAA